MYTTLISGYDLASNMFNPDWVIVDVRFTLGESQRGWQDYQRGHIPGAVYAHLEKDLCAAPEPGITGRHPLPSIEFLASKFSEWGIDSSVQVVAYDDSPGIGLSTAPRLWWTLKWLGHASVAVLDGGWTHWQALRLPVEMGDVPNASRRFVASVRSELLVNSKDVEQLRLNPRYLIFDSRSAERYRGENETIDPVAGHIPGAISAPYLDNIHSSGLFLSKQELHARFTELLGGVPATGAVFYCGSGVTAANNLLALAHAGLGEGRLYPGSWSEWITDPNRPTDK
jgi:thiosulfate/3-mercaptopyruvate sulfurtransferase